MNGTANVNELGRRICLANHPLLASRPAPCPTHLSMARNLWGLVTTQEQKTLNAVVEYAVELGLRTPEVVFDVTKPEHRDLMRAALEDPATDLVGLVSRDGSIPGFLAIRVPAGHIDG